MCDENCRKGLLNKIKPYAFSLFAKKYGEDQLLDCLERNEKNGIAYHSQGISGDYDNFDDVGDLIHLSKMEKERQIFQPLLRVESAVQIVKRNLMVCVKAVLKKTDMFRSGRKQGVAKYTLVQETITYSFAVFVRSSHVTTFPNSFIGILILLST